MLDRRSFLKVLGAIPLVGLPVVEEPADLVPGNICEFCERFDPAEWHYRITVAFADGNRMEFSADQKLVEHCIKLVEETRDEVTMTVWNGTDVWMIWHTPMPSIEYLGTPRMQPTIDAIKND